MYSVRFRGRVFPPDVSLSISFPPMKWSVAKNQPGVLCMLNIADSLIDMRCEVDSRGDWNVAHLSELYRIAFEFARASVDVTAFSKGVGLSTVIDTFEDPHGNVSPLAMIDPRLSQLCTAFDVENEDSYSEIMKIVLGERPLYLAFNELILSITLPDYAPVACARVIERLRHIITKDKISRDEQWTRFRDSLRIDKRYLELITSASTGPRHGDPAPISPATTLEITFRSWAVMNRFLEFRKGGNIALPEDRFPMLTG